MFLMKVIQKIRFALVIENEIFYINGSETLPHRLHEKKNSILWRILQKETARQENRLLSTI